MLSIVIPTYKEAQNVNILLPKIYQTILPQVPNLKIIIVDDDSNDGIEDIVGQHNVVCGNIIQLIVRKNEKGLASAWKCGINAAVTPIVGIMDADLAHAPQDILKMLDKMETTLADMVIGSRYLPGHIVAMKSKSAFAIYLSSLGQKLSRIILGVKIYDMSHSLRIFRSEVFDKVGKLLECEGNAMMIEFTFHAFKAGFKIEEVTISYGERVFGETKLGIFREGSRFLKILLNLRKKYAR